MAGTSNADVAWITGDSRPIYKGDKGDKGGPMFRGDTVGLPKALDRCSNLRRNCVLNSSPPH